ncbi:MAG TPA: histidinol dehydrogenase [Acidimicrobiales bacterium]|nr:histidinol dehydrogenase [Acidimicrobiales bacterium]
MSKLVKTERPITIEEIVNDVRSRGDVAVAEWSNRFDGTTGERPARAVAYGDIPTAAVLAAADAVRTWHAAQRPADLMMEVSPGVTLERRWSPLRSVGIYVPKNLVSSLIMSAVPAQVAGVERIVVCTPPEGSAAVAAAAALLGIDEVWAIGGAQAIAAMAYGTESIAPVDKIFGPGSGPVNRAKLLVSQDVAIDLPAGPSEIVVVADEGYDEVVIAQEIAAQLEHGPDSKGYIVRVGDDLEAALLEVEGYAAEHVALLGEKSESLAGRIRNAGAVFVGLYSPVPAGDYATGGNHVLPTGGWAKSTGGLGLEAFMKTVTVQRVTKEGLERLAPTIEALAELEGMTAHKATARR